MSDNETEKGKAAKNSNATTGCTADTISMEKLKNLYCFVPFPERKKPKSEIIVKSYPMDDPERMKNYYAMAEAEYGLYKANKLFDKIKETGVNTKNYIQFDRNGKNQKSQV
jgi:hypothetical protein